jgi:SSS family solute:Na+ symporter
MYAARDLKTIHLSALWIPVWSFLLTLPIMLVGLMGHELLPELTDQTSDMLVPILFKTYAPFLGMFLVAAAFAAGMSTVDSMLLSVSSIFEEDVYRRFMNPDASETRRTWMGKLFIVFFVLLLVWFSFSEIAQGFLTPIADKGGELACMLLPATLGPLFWPRATRQGAIASLASGFLVICLLMIPRASALLPETGYLHYSIIVGFLVSLGTFYGVSLVTQPVPYSKQEAFHGYINSVLYESQVATEGAYDPQTR